MIGFGSAIPNPVLSVGIEVAVDSVGVEFSGVGEMTASSLEDVELVMTGIKGLDAGSVI